MKSIGKSGNIISGVAAAAAKVAEHNSSATAHPGEIITVVRSSANNLPTGTLVNAETGRFGYEFTPIRDLEVTHLGRWFPSGTGNHAIQLFRVSDTALLLNETVLGASTSDTWSYKWVQLSTPLVLNAGVAYAILSSETNGGDTWPTDYSISTTSKNLDHRLTPGRKAWSGSTGTGFPTLSSPATAKGAPAFKFREQAQVFGHPLPEDQSQQHEANPRMVLFMGDGTGDARPDILQVRDRDQTNLYWPIKTKIGPYGEILTNAWVIISGTEKFAAATGDSSMLSIVPDVSVGMEIKDSIAASRLAQFVTQSGAYALVIEKTGQISFGAGTYAQLDAYIKRAAAGVVAVSKLGVSNAASATTPGSCVKKIEVFDAAGVSLGFVPVYSSIT